MADKINNFTTKSRPERLEPKLKKTKLILRLHKIELLQSNLSILRQTKDKLTMKDELPENEQNRTVEGLSGKNESLCGCGKPVRYLDVSDQNKGSCNKYMRCLTYEEMQETLRGANRMLMAYQVAVNQFDDYFDHINESIKDRKKVHQILGNLTDELKRT